MARKQVTPESFAVSLLNQLGIRPNPQNTRALVAWQKREGGNWNNTAHHNPLNTTQNAPGASSMNSVGVKAYPDWKTGLRATVQTLKNGHYPDIIRNLAHGSASDIGNSPSLSTWGTGQFNPNDYSLGPSGGRVIGGGSGGLGAPPTRGHQQPGKLIPGKAPTIIKPQTTTDYKGALLDALLATKPGERYLDKVVSGISSGQYTTTTPGVIKPGKSSKFVPGKRVQGTSGGGLGASGRGASGAVAYAEKQLAKGRHEPGGENRGPYVDKLNRSFGMLGQPWCAMFTSVAVEHGGAPASARTASVAMVRQWAGERSHGYSGFVSARHAQPGDLILYGNDHIGMVKENTGKGLVTIEGNYSDRVGSRTVAYGAGDIVRPKYAK